MRLYSIIVVMMSVTFGTGLHAQFQYDNQWIFSFEDDTTSILDFRRDSLVVRKVFQDMKIGFTNTSISDNIGNFLFYSNGCYINNAGFQLMENGTGLNPGDVVNDQCSGGYTAGHQSLLILPDNNDSLFYIFHKRIIIDTNTEILIVTDSLMLTIVDLTDNGGLGSIIQKNFPINSQRLSYGQMNAVKKEDGNGWWIISGVFDSNEYEIYHLYHFNSEMPH